MKQPHKKQRDQLSNLHVWLLTLVYGMLAVAAAAATTRLPFYLAGQDYGRIAGLTLFWFVVLAGLADNVRTHLSLWQQARTAAPQTPTVHSVHK